MKLHTTNYNDTFIEVAEDCPVTTAEMPALKGDKKTVANYHFEMLYEHPYQFTSDDVIFQTYAIRNEIAKPDLDAARQDFFSKGQPCLRTSPLAKRYGWGIHSDAQGRVAIYACESAGYRKLAGDKKLVHTRAMKTKR